MPLSITELFNDATTREIGGVGPDQVNLIVSDLVGVQEGLKAAFPQVSDLTSLHAQVIENQLNQEIAAVENVNSPTGTQVLGTDLGQYVGRTINDIHRDIIDIAQGDPGLQAAFNPTTLTALNTPPAPSTMMHRKRRSSHNSFRTQTISGRRQSRLRMPVSLETPPGSFSKSRPSSKTPTHSPNRKAACIVPGS